MNCKKCGRPMTWAKTESGQNIPLDPQPVAGGNLEVDVTGTARVVKTDPAVFHYVSHFATCPHAADFRKKKEKP